MQHIRNLFFFFLIFNYSYASQNQNNIHLEEFDTSKSIIQHQMPVKNIIFDIGNVLVKWAPDKVVSSIFPDENPKEFLQKLHPIYIEWSLGHLNQEKVITACHDQFKLPALQMKELIHKLTTSQTPIEESISLIQKLDQAGYPLYSITNNTKEVMKYHEENSHFLHYFKEVICSADVGLVKPDPAIYRLLLDRNNLNPGECLFIDDLAKNVEAARAVGMQAYQFTDSLSFESYIKSLISNNNL